MDETTNSHREAQVRTHAQQLVLLQTSLLLFIVIMHMHHISGLNLLIGESSSSAGFLSFLKEEPLPGLSPQTIV